MKKIFIISIIIIFSLNIYPIDFSLSLNSSYIWRGFDLVPDDKPVVFFTVSDDFDNFLSGELYLETFFAYSFEMMGSDKHYSELDLTAGFRKKLNKDMEIETGLTLYTFPYVEDFLGKNSLSPELFLTLNFLKKFSPFISVYYDMNLGGGFYFVGGLEDEIFYGINLKTKLGYNSGQFIESSTLSDLSIELSRGFYLGNVHLILLVEFVHIFSREINPEENEFLYGVNFYWK